MEPSPLISPIGSLPQTVDSTMLVTFRACPQQFYNRYVMKLAGRAKSGHLIAGGAIAAGLEVVRKEVYANGKTLEQAYLPAYKAFVEEWGPYVPPEEDAKSFGRCWDAIEKYFEKYPPISDELQPLRTQEGKPFVEFSFAVATNVKHPESGEPFIYSGRFDVLGSWMGKIVVSDEKTTGQMGKNWVRQWDLRNQFMSYCWGAQHFGYKVNDALVRGICILKKDTKLAQAPAHFPDWMLERFEHQLHRDLTRMVQCWKDKEWDYDFGDSCTSFGGCTFADLCVSQRPEVWYKHFDRLAWNPITRTHEPVQ